MRTPSDADLLQAYGTYYGLAPMTCTIDDVRRHLDLERRLRAEMLAATPDDRPEVFAASYERLYTELPWLASVGSSCEPVRWSRLLGRPPARVYEVGSGHGDLARGLVKLGYDVTATDLSSARGDRHDSTGLTWAPTDGVHLTHHAERGAFDAVISSQVIEHLHPDDVLTHFREAFRLLAPGGRYLVSTPHVLTGPHDIGQLVGAPSAWGMHLKEYTVREIADLMRGAGFRRVATVAYVPRIARLTAATVLHRRYLQWLESRRFVRSPAFARALRRVKAPVRPDVWLVAE